MAKGIFITGTDTGVGKTFIGAGIAAALRSGGVNVGVMKPAETGCRSRAGALYPADAHRLIKAAGVGDSWDLINPYRFRKPLAPYMAAELEKTRIHPRDILAAFKMLSRRHEFMIVEGAGGIMVPLSGDYLYLDLAADLNLPALIVARPGLGTINHTLLTISALKRKKIKIAGVVINYSKDWRKGKAERTNPGVIENISGVKILGIAEHGTVKFEGIINAMMK